ncbi:bifunctional riboflavin kinase/FAD synthetase [Terracidiphilus gabretensis]|uniref:bifunctional riboflavin kinase/FAD synthetase n=1 Tax=Terracidiphilus gabretensis TaxID=1577687 RepID=UPI001E4F5C9A|nr:bifunctional riboflavin kinase/FAD synthetase [Terracidiphilus gabretensis]
MIPVYRSLAEIPATLGPTVAAIGNFDGVHLGHRQLLGAAVAEARQNGFRAIAVTFEPHPEHFLRPDKAPKRITPKDERLLLLAETGIDSIVVLPFDAAFARLTAREFVEQVLVRALQIRRLHEGGSFRFGHRAQAGVKELAEFGKEFSFGLTIHEPVHVHGLEVSSSAIRAAVTAGDMKCARWMLNRPFVIRSTQAHGRGVGSRLLVPTVNLAAYDGLLPAFGVYVTRLTIGERCFESVSNVGNRPTFEGAGFSIETHILNFEPVDLTDETPLELEFLFYLREEIRFPSVDALKAQIGKDVARAKRYFRLAHLP